MSREHGGLLGRSSSLPHSTLRRKLWPGCGRIFESQAIQRKSRFLCVLKSVFLCIYMLSLHPNMLKYRYDNIITETHL